ncbi:hypothetical protein AURDEDRAFT_112070 [Auricularia subglabra TFB-10046 SS5]|nr:hypothetical protein AURDEDRAFT_112070 [Auricularia subglabra TFB-10046 SS5]
MSNSVTNAARVAVRTASAAPRKPPLTHFLSIPLGHIPALRERLSTFYSALLASEPAITGLDSSVIIPPRRVHITLGVLSLVKEEDKIKDASQTTIAKALDILLDLKGRLEEEIAATGPVQVPLVAMDIMRSAKGNATPHVLYVGPKEGEVEGTAIQRVSNIVINAFREAGIMQDDRPLKLHCTVVNTIYRKPRSKKRIPFSFGQIKTSKALADILVEDSEPQQQNAGDKALRVDLGIWEVDEVQLCEMGSHDEEGAYVRVGGVSLRPEA